MLPYTENTSIRICPSDPARSAPQEGKPDAAAGSFESSYEYIAAGAIEADGENSRVCFVCQIHRNITLCDGSVQQLTLEQLPTGSPGREDLFRTFDRHRSQSKTVNPIQITGVVLALVAAGILSHLIQLRARIHSLREERELMTAPVGAPPIPVAEMQSAAAPVLGPRN